MPRICADDADGVSCCLVQNVVDDGLVLKRDRGDWCRDGEDDMEIGDRQKFGQRSATH
jgi:hypothetical protein